MHTITWPNHQNWLRVARHRISMQNRPEEKISRTRSENRRTWRRKSLDADYLAMLWDVKLMTGPQNIQEGEPSRELGGGLSPGSVRGVD